MTAFAGMLAIGGSIVDGVLTELPGVTRQAVAGDLETTQVTLSASATFGPFQTAIGPLGAFAIFDEATGLTMLCSGSIAGLTVQCGQLLTFPIGTYAVTAGVAPGGDVLTLNGAPLLVDGQPLQVA